MTLALFNWSRAAGGAQMATWGRYSAFLAHHRSGAWAVDLYHGTKRTRHEELDASLSLAEARTTAEQFLLDEQGPEVRELVRRTRLAEGRGAGTVRLRAVGGGGSGSGSGGKRRKAMGKTETQLRWEAHLKRQGGPSYKGERRVLTDNDRDTCESCGASDGWPHTAVLQGAGGERVELSLCKKCQNDRGIWSALLLRNPKRMSPAIRAQVEVARANRFGGKKRHARGGKRRHAKRPPARGRLGALVADINKLTK